MNGLLVFPCHKTNKTNKQTNKQENADSIKKKRVNNERVAYIPACS